jgi:hypothetical protein
MKKLSAILVGMSLVAGAVMAAGPVTSVNAVGYVNVSLQSNVWNLVCMPFEKIDKTNPTVGEVFDPDGSGLPAGLAVLLWNGVTYVNEDYYAGYGFYPGTNVIVRGSGAWVRSPVSIILSLAGQVPSTNVTTTTLLPGYNLMSFPYPVAMAISNTVLQSLGSAGDSILKVLPTGGYANADFYAGFGWYPADFLLNPGEGYWYKSQAAISTNWNQTKPYDWP